MTPRTALGALHIGALMFGLTGVFGKLAVASASIIVFGRAAFAVLALAFFARFASQTRWQKLEAVDVRRLLLSGLLLAGHWVSFFVSVKIAGVAIATLGFASFPAFTVILEGLIFRERIRANEILLVALVSVGLVLVTPEFDLGSGATTGLLWSIASGLLFSLLSLTNRASSARIPPVQAALCQNVVVGLCLLPAAAPHLSEV
jgi:drug/metabolite transporter (DMT)-like permease